MARPILFKRMDRTEICHASTVLAAMAGLAPAIHPCFEKTLRRAMDTRVKPAYDKSRSRLLRELGQRLAGNLPEGMGKRRDAGIAEVGRQLLDRNTGVGGEFFDGGGDAGALAPALET